MADSCCFPGAARSPPFAGLHYYAQGPLGACPILSDAARDALTADRHGSLVEELTAFFGGTSGLYWTLYRSIWPDYDRRLQDVALGLLGLEMVDYGDIEEGFRFVQRRRSEAAEA